MSWEWTGDGLRLWFALPPGSYATVVLRELGDITDASERATP
jgi:tRNA pseudouridine13 synthase